MRKGILMVVILIAYSASAQVVSGTIVIFNFTKDKFVVAADSLAHNYYTGVPDYAHCKIAAFDHKLVFTSVGSSAWIAGPGQKVLEPWDNIEVCRHVFSTLPKIGITNLEAIGSQWANELRDHWTAFSNVDRQAAIDITSNNNGQFTAAVFINTQPAVKVVLINYNRLALGNPVEIAMSKSTSGDDITPCWPCGQLQGRICAIGRHLDVAAKFCSQRKHGDRVNIRTHLRGATESTKLAVKIVEMTIDAYGKTAKDVGGTVDSLTVSKDGVAWNSNPNCPEDSN